MRSGRALEGGAHYVLGQRLDRLLSHSVRPMEDIIYREPVNIHESKEEKARRLVAAEEEAMKCATVFNLIATALGREFMETAWPHLGSIRFSLTWLLEHAIKMDLDETRGIPVLTRVDEKQVKYATMFNLIATALGEKIVIKELDGYYGEPEDVNPYATEEEE